MKRFSIVFHSLSTGMGMEFDRSDTPVEALKKGRDANTQGLRDVRIVDSTTNEAMDVKAFAAKHRL